MIIISSLTETKLVLCPQVLFGIRSIQSQSDLSEKIEHFVFQKKSIENIKSEFLVTSK